MSLCKSWKHECPIESVLRQRAEAAEARADRAEATLREVRAYAEGRIGGTRREVLAILDAEGTCPDCDGSGKNPAPEGSEP